VGRALSTLELEGLEAFRTAVENGRLTVPETARRLASVRQILRPLFEGVALFAEHDVFPGRSEVGSTLLLWTAILFRPYPDPPDASQITTVWIDQMLQRLLMVERLSPRWVERKAHLLLQPLELSQGGYLAGYLVVKNLWIMAGQRSSRLKDSSLFLAYFISLVFDDYGLVRLLLDDEIEEESRAALMRDQVGTRLTLLIHSRDLDAHVAEYEAAIASQPSTGDLEGHYRSIFIDERDVQAQKAAASTRLQRFVPRTLDAAKADMFGVLHMSAVLHHSMMRLAVEDVEVDITGNGRCVVTSNGAQVFDDVAVAGLQPGAGPGVLALYYDSKSSKNALICTRGSDLAYVFLPDAMDDVDRRVLAGAVTLTVRTEPIISGLRAAIARDLVGTEDPDGWFAKTFPKSLEDMYWRFALGFVEQETTEACKDAMRADGFLELLGEEPQLVRALALLGLMSSCRFSNAAVGAAFADHDLDEVETRRALSASWRTWGFPLLGAEPGSDLPPDSKTHIFARV